VKYEMGEMVEDPNGYGALKFVARQYMDSFFDRGNLRLGTVHNFRDTLEHSQARGDSAEGHSAVIRDFAKGEVFEDYEGELVPMLKAKAARGGKIVFGPGSKIRGFYNSPDAYIFCTSAKFSEDLLKRWASEARADACYVIEHVIQFGQAVAEAVVSHPRHQGWVWDAFGSQAVTYVDGIIDAKDPAATVHPGFVKQKDGYEWQAEYRCVFAPKWDDSMKLDPLVLDVPAARTYCRPFAYLDGSSVKYF
jgi:hypothetical protein